MFDDLRCTAVLAATLAAMLRDDVVRQAAGRRCLDGDVPWPEAVIVAWAARRSADPAAQRLARTTWDRWCAANPARTRPWDPGLLARPDRAARP